MSSDNEWTRRVRRAQAERAAAMRRHPASGPPQPDRKPEETTMPENINQPDPPPEWCRACPDPGECTTTRACTIQAEQKARHHRIEALIASVEADQTTREKRPSPWEWAARYFEQTAPGTDPSDRPGDADLSDRP